MEITVVWCMLMNATADILVLGVYGYLLWFSVNGLALGFGSARKMDYLIIWICVLFAMGKAWLYVMFKLKC